MVSIFPDSQELFKPQNPLLQYVIAQPYSRDIICSMLGLNKQVTVFVEV